MAKTKIDPYKLVKSGSASGNVTPATASARKTLYATNRLGLTVGSIGKVVGDIESIAIATIKDEKRREILERKRLRREADEAAENERELAGLAKKSKKKPKISNSMKTTMKKSPLAKFVEGFLGPIGTFLVQMGTWAFMKELIAWAADDSNLKKIEVFLEKIHFVFKKLASFSDWLIGDKFLGGFSKLVGEDSTFGERVSGLWDLFQGIVVLKLLFNPFGLLGDILLLLGMFGDRFANWRGNKMPKHMRKPNPKNRGWFQRSRKTATTSGGTSTGRFGKVRDWFKKFRPKTKPTISGQSGGGNWFTNLFKKKPKVTTGTGGTGGNFFSNLFKGSSKVTEGTGGTQRNWITSLFKKENVTGGTKTTVGDLFRGGRENVTNFFKDGTKNTKSWWQKSGKTTLTNLGKKIKPKGSWFRLGNLKNLKNPVSSIIMSMGVQKLYDAMDEGTANILSKQILSLNADQQAKAIQRIIAKIDKEEKWKENPLYKGQQVMAFLGSLVGDKGETNASGEIKLNNLVLQKLRENGVDVDGLGLAGEGSKQEMFFGGIIKGIGKAVSGVVKGVGSAVSGVVNTVGKIASNPIIGTALSFIPGMQIPMAVINGIGALQQGNIMGALSAGLGGLGAFANINTVNAISQPQWMQNLRFSSFGQGVANMYHSGANAFSALSTGFNNFMGSNIGQIGKGVLQGVTGGGWGGLGGTLAGMTGIGDITGKMGSFADKWGLGGIGNLVPGLGSTLGNIGLGDLPGMGSLFGGSFNAMGPIGALADKFGLSGIMDAVTGMMASGDMMTGLRELAPELGVSPEVLGIYDEGRKYFTDGKFNSQMAMQTAIEFIPIPMVIQKLEIAPAGVPINTGGGSSGGISSLLGRLGG